jgi:hypothetical protein
MSVVRITRTELDDLLHSVPGFNRFRSPFGVVHATQAAEDMDLLTSGGPLHVGVGDYLCIAEDVCDCWTISPTVFSSIYELLQ